MKIKFFHALVVAAVAGGLFLACFLTTNCASDDDSSNGSTSSSSSQSSSSSSQDPHFYCDYTSQDSTCVHYENIAADSLDDAQSICTNYNGTEATACPTAYTASCSGTWDYTGESGVEQGTFTKYATTTPDCTYPRPAGGG